MHLRESSCLMLALLTMTGEIADQNCSKKYCRIALKWH